MDSEKLNNWLTLIANTGVAIGLALLNYWQSAAYFLPFWEKLGIELGDGEFDKAIREFEV